MKSPKGSHRKKKTAFNIFNEMIGMGQIQNNTDQFDQKVIDSLLSNYKYDPPLDSNDKREKKEYYDNIEKGIYLPGIRKLKNNDDILEIVSNSATFPIILQSLSNSISVSNDNFAKQMCCLFLLLDLITFYNFDENKNENDLIKRELTIINKFPKPLDTMEEYKKLRSVLEKLIDSMKSISDDKFFAKIQRIDGPYLPFIIATHTIKHTDHLSHEFRSILEEVTPGDPISLLSVSIFFETHNFSDFNEDLSLIFTDFGGESKLTELAINYLNGTRLQRRIAIQLIKSLLMFLTNTDSMVTLFSTLDPLIQLIDQVDKVVKLELVTLFSVLPPVDDEKHDENLIGNTDQILKFLKPLCEHLDTLEGPYAEALCKFAAPRRNSINFNTIISKMFATEKSYCSALVISDHLNLYNDEMYQNAFPSSPVDFDRFTFTLEALKFLAGRNKLNKIALSNSLDQMFNTFVNCHEDDKQYEIIQKKVFDVIDYIVPLMLQFHEDFCQQVLKNFGFINNHDFFDHFAKAVEKVEPNENNEDLYHAEPEIYSAFYCKLFLTLYEFEDRNYLMFQILRIFVPSITEQPTILSSMIPDNSIENVKKHANFILKAQNHPEIAIICASLPTHDEKEIETLVSTVSSKYDSKMFNEFFLTLSHTYLKETLVSLKNLALGKKFEQISMMSSRKKKDNIKQMIDDVFSLMKKLIEINEINVEEEVLMYEIIHETLPSKAEKILEVSDEASQLNDIFSSLKDINVPTDLATKLVVLPLFADSIPIFAKSLQGNIQLALTMVKTWRSKLLLEPEAYKRMEPIMNTIYKVSNDPIVFLTILDLSLVNFSNPKTRQAFVAFSLSAAKFAYENKIEFQDISNFILALSEVIVCNESETRYESFEILYYLLNTEIPENLRNEVTGNLSPSKLKENAIDVFTMLIVKATTEQLVTFLQAIVSLKSVDYHHSLILRCILENRKDYMDNESAIQSITSLIENVKNMSQISLIEMEAGLMKLASNSMEKFVPLFFTVSIKNPYRKQLMTCLLLSEEHRSIFLKYYHQFLVEATAQTKSLMIYGDLALIIDTEPEADVSAETFGCITTDLIFCMAYAYLKMKDLGKNLKSITEDISSSFTALFSKTSIVTTNASMFVQMKERIRVSININDFQSISTSLKTIADLIAKLKLPKLQLLKEKFDPMLKSPNENVLFFIAIFDIHLENNYRQYQGKKSHDFNDSLTNQITNALVHTNILMRRFLATIMPCDHYQYYNSEDLALVFEKITESLADPMPAYRLESLDSYSALMKKVSAEVIEKNHEMILTALRNTFPVVPLNKSSINLLKRYTRAHKDINEFVTDVAPNFETILLFVIGNDADKRILQTSYSLFLTSSKEENERKLKEKNEINQKAHDLFERFGIKEIADTYTPDLLKSTMARVIEKASGIKETLDNYWFNLISDLALKVIANQNADDDFKVSLFFFVWEDSADDTSTKHEKATEVMKIVMNSQIMQE